MSWTSTDFSSKEQFSIKRRILSLFKSILWNFAYNSLQHLDVISPKDSHLPILGILGPKRKDNAEIFKFKLKQKRDNFMQNKSAKYPEPSQMPKLFPYYWGKSPGLSSLTFCGECWWRVWRQGWGSGWWAVSGGRKAGRLLTHISKSVKRCGRGQVSLIARWSLWRWQFQFVIVSR